MNRFPRPFPRIPRRRGRTFRPRLQPLEARDLPSTIVDLGNLGGFYTSANGLNNAGQVVGRSDLGASSRHHAFLWQDGRMADLGTLGGDDSEATAINDAGQIVGYADTVPGAFSAHAFLYRRGVMTDLGTLGATYSFAYGINAAGQVVGELDYFDGRPDVYHSFLYADGTMTDLGSLGGTFSIAYGINDAGQVVGTSSPAGSYPAHAYLGTAGQLADLGTLGGASSVAARVNDAGQVAGVADLDDAHFHAFLWQDGVMTDLGTLGGDWSKSSGLNQAGQVVGWSTTVAGDSSFQGFLYSDGTMTDVNQLLPPDANWTITTANGINDNGQIIGFGTHNQIPYHAYLLTLDAPGKAGSPAGPPRPLPALPALTRPGVSTSTADEVVSPREWPSAPVMEAPASTATQPMPASLDRVATSTGADETLAGGAVDDQWLDEAARIG